MRWAPVLVLVLGSLLMGCPLAPTGLAEGSRCVRSTQCAPALVCSAAGTCTSDLTGFGTGMVPVTDVMMMDAGVPEDAPMMDVPGLDAPVIPMDVPVVPMDVPVVPMDVPVDTGVDSGMPDTPPVEPDVPMEDAGVPEVDAPV